LQGFCGGAVDGHDLEYARMCGDMQRFGNFGAEVPEIDGLGLISAQRQAREVSGKFYNRKTCQIR